MGPKGRGEATAERWRRFGRRLYATCVSAARKAAPACAGQAITCRARPVLPTSSYATLCYGTAALLLGIAVLGMDIQITGHGWPTWAALLALGLVSQVIGHTSYNWTLATLPPAFVAICLLGEPVLGALLGWLYLAEPVSMAAFGAGILIGVDGFGDWAAQRLFPEVAAGGFRGDGGLDRRAPAFGEGGENADPFRHQCLEPGPDLLGEDGRRAACGDGAKEGRGQGDPKLCLRRAQAEGPLL